MKEFFSAAKEHIGDEEGDIVEVKVDGRELRFVRPSDTQLAIILAMGGREMDLKQFGTFVSLFTAMGDEETEAYLLGELVKRDTKLGVDVLFSVFEHCVEEWSARPTKSPSDYQPPRRKTGSKSTATSPAKASTSSRSRSRASSR